MITIKEVKNHNLQNAEVFQYDFFENGRIGSAVVIVYHGDKERHIASVAIESNERGKGYGSQLIQQIITDNKEDYRITAYSGLDLEKFWFKNGLNHRKRMKPEGLYEYFKRRIVSRFTIISCNKTGKSKKISVPEERIFQEPEEKDDPMIFWLWEKNFKAAFVVRKKPKRNPIDIIVMNLYSLKNMTDSPENMVGCALYLSAVMVEELTHCATGVMKNHKYWTNFLIKLQEKLHG